MQPISTIILTKNEEENIERCLKSVAGLSDELVVVDCYSEDNTVDIAKRYTNNIYQNVWPGFSEQRKFALSKTKNDWILWIDADEEISPELDAEIRGLDFRVEGYRIPRLVFFLGRWIRHCGWYPDYTLRLFNKRAGQFTADRVHEKFVVSGKTARIRNPMFHYSTRNISHRMEKMDVYTSLAAQQMAERGRKASIFAALSHALTKFVKMYLLKLGFMDGKAGLIICLTGSYYVFLKYVKHWERVHCLSEEPSKSVKDA